MTANELRENCREYYWQEIQADEKLKTQYEFIVNRMIDISKKGHGNLTLTATRSIQILEYLAYSGFEVENSLGETIISWKAGGKS